VQPPDVKFIKKESGGIGFQEATKQTKGVNAEVARLICKEYKISCAEIISREDITVDQVCRDGLFWEIGNLAGQYHRSLIKVVVLRFLLFGGQLIDVIEGDRAYIPGTKPLW
jgi:ribosome-interacting GTPase 1